VRKVRAGPSVDQTWRKTLPIEQHLEADEIAAGQLGCCGSFGRRAMRGRAALFRLRSNVRMKKDDTRDNRQG
jgi:hypothetical protein